MIVCIYYHPLSSSRSLLGHIITTFSMIDHPSVPSVDYQCLGSRTAIYAHSKPSRVFMPSQFALVLLLLQQNSQAMVQTPHVSTIADLEYQKLHQYFPGLSPISTSLAPWLLANLYNTVYLSLKVLLELLAWSLIV